MKAGTRTPWRRDPADVHRGLQSWATAFRGERAIVSEVRAPESGMANDTVLFSLDEEPLVARLAPLATSQFPTFESFDLAFQRRAMELARERTAVPVPEVVALEASEAWLGSSFLVLRAVDGVVPSDNPAYPAAGWMLEGTSEQRQHLETSSIQILVDLHTVPGDDDDTAFLRAGPQGGTALAGQLEAQERYYTWASEGETVPLVERALELLAGTLPGNERCVLNWGDSRIGNMIYRDFEPVAVLDWEMATVGPPEADLAWMMFFHAFLQWIATAQGFPGLPDLFDRSRVVATYEERSGTTLEDLTWYEAFAALRYALISLRTSHRAVAYGLNPPPAKPDQRILGRHLLKQRLTELENLHG